MLCRIQAASKRRVVVLRAQGNPGSAVTALNAHLEIHVADAEAWEELLGRQVTFFSRNSMAIRNVPLIAYTAVYVHAKQWSQAAHCAEELILLRPTLYGHYLNYADVGCDVRRSIAVFLSHILLVAHSRSSAS